MSEQLELALRKYVRPNAPFGPVDADATVVAEPSCAAALYDWNNQAFAELLVGSDVLVGRRGSGKSSLLRSFLVRKYLSAEFSSDEAREFRERYHISPKILSRTPDLVIEVNTTAHVDELEERLSERSVLPSVTVMAGLWRKRMWWLVGKELEKIDGVMWSGLPSDLRDFITSNDVKLDSKRSSYSGSGAATDQYISELEKYFAERKIRVVVTFDNVEQHKFQPRQDAVLSGLIALAGAFIGSEHPSLDIKLCLPAELFRQLKKLAFRPDKDLHTIQYLHWNAAELLHLAARRLRVYLSLWDKEQFAEVKDRKLNERQPLRDFWHRYFPIKITNSVDIEEDTITYILRHTQMLPRQLISVLNAICKRSGRDSSEMFATRFDRDSIIKGIEDTEEPSKEAILMMFRPVYPNIDDIFDIVMPRLAREFTYGHLHKVWRTGAKSLMVKIGKGDFISFWQLMLSTGAVGMKVSEREGSSEIYSTARFEFNTKYDLSISDKDVLCVHPMFSRVYNIERREDLKLILPRGSDFRLDLQA